MSQFVRTNEIYGEVAKVINVISTNFLICATLYNVSSSFNLHVGHFLKKNFFFLKFLFMEVIHCIYLVLVQNLPAILQMYYNRQTCIITDIVRGSNWVFNVNLYMNPEWNFFAEIIRGVF